MKTTEKRQGGNPLVTLFAYFGGYIINVVYIFLHKVWSGIRTFFRSVWSATGRLRKTLSRKLEDLCIWAFTPPVNFIRFIRGMNKEVRDTRKEKGRLAAFGCTLKQIMRSLFGEKGVLAFLLNYAAPVVSVIFLFSVVTYANSINYAVKLTVNGQFIGYIENEQVFTEAKQIMQERVDYIGGIDVETKAEFSVEPVGGSETLNPYRVADLMLQNSGVSLTYGYGFYINDTFYGALEDYTKVEKTLDSLLARYKTSNPTEEVAFIDKINYSQSGLFLTDSIVDEDWLIGVITDTREVTEYYEVELGDSHTLIGDKVKMTQLELEKLNPGFADQDLKVGDKILVTSEQPYLSVGISKLEEYDVEVDYDTEYYEDNTIYEGSSREARPGENGINHITARVTYINGEERSRSIVKVDTVLEPVSQQIAIGTKPTPAGTFSGATAAYGKFIWPVIGGEISQLTHWEGGYSGHSGIDISGIGYGSPVYAGAAGVVTYSGWSWGYGYHVVIYHADLGVSTLYAHNSTLYVSTGETVAQGQCIAGAGATGKASGIHVHFEVRINNSPVNPMAYIDIPPGTRIYNW